MVKEGFGDNVAGAVRRAALARVIWIIFQTVAIVDGDFFAGRNRHYAVNPNLVGNLAGFTVRRTTVIEVLGEIVGNVAVHVDFLVQAENVGVSFLKPLDGKFFGDFFADISSDLRFFWDATAGKGAPMMDGGRSNLHPLVLAGREWGFRAGSDVFGGQKAFQRADIASRVLGTAEIFSDVHNLGMVVLPIVQPVLLGRIGQLGLAKSFDLMIVGGLLNPAVSRKDSLGVGVDDERRMISGVEKNAVRSFRPDAADAQQLFAGGLGILLEKGIQRTSIMAHDSGDERFETFGFDIIIAGRTNKLGQRILLPLVDGADVQGAVSFEVLNGLLDVLPIGVLGKNGADANFKRTFPRPPTPVPRISPHLLVSDCERRNHFKELKSPQAQSRRRVVGSLAAQWSTRHFAKPADEGKNQAFSRRQRNTGLCGT